MLKPNCDYFTFHKALVPGDRFKAKFVMKNVGSADYNYNTTDMTFMITKIYPRVAIVCAWYEEFKIISHINLIDLWKDRENAVILPHELR